MGTSEHSNYMDREDGQDSRPALINFKFEF